MKTTMRCADEGFIFREFEMDGSPEEYDGPPDYVCTHCGWIQTDVIAGGKEIINSVTWHSDIARAEYEEQLSRIENEAN